MTHEEQLALRKTLIYLADVLLLAETIENMNSCNNCAVRRKCEYCPRPGKNVRYNCPLWKDGDCTLSDA